MSKHAKHQHTETDKPLLASKKKQKTGLSSKAKNRLYAAVAIFIALSLLSMVVVSMVSNSGTLVKNANVISVGSETLKGDELEFYYYATVNQYRMQAMQMYEAYGFDLYGIDFSISLFKQEYDTGQSWGEIVRNAAVDRLYHDTLLVQAAAKDNFTLSDELRAEADKTVEEMQDYAETSGMTYAALLRANFGKTITPEAYRKFVERDLLISAFVTDKAEGFPIDQTALDARYTQEPSDFDLLTYYYLEIPVTIDEDAADEEAAMAEALAAEKEAIAAKLKNISEEDFLAWAKEATTTTDSDGETVEGKTKEELLSENVNSSYISADLAPWIYDDARQKGDIEVTEGTSSVLVYYFLDKNAGEYAARHVRHILFAFETDADEEAKDALLADMQTFYQEWQDGGKTEESFALLAEEHSEDPGSAEAGGLYENVLLGMMVKEFENWLFDTDRKVGDTGIVQTEHGFHLMYYVGEGERARDIAVESVLRDEMYNDYYAALEEASPLVRHESGIARVK